MEKWLSIPGFTKYEINEKKVVRNATTKVPCTIISKASGKHHIYNDQKQRVIVHPDELFKKVKFVKEESKPESTDENISVAGPQVTTSDDKNDIEDVKETKKEPKAKVSATEKAAAKEKVAHGKVMYSKRDYDKKLASVEAHQHAPIMKKYLEDEAGKNDKVRKLLSLGVEETLIAFVCKVRPGTIYNIKLADEKAKAGNN